MAYFAVHFLPGLVVAAAFIAVFLFLKARKPGNTAYKSAVGLIGAIIARFEPHGMVRAMLATALAQALVAAIALVGGWGFAAPIWPRDILGVTGIFVTLWLGSAWLFRRAAPKVTPEGAGAEG